MPPAVPESEGSGSDNDIPPKAQPKTPQNNATADEPEDDEEEEEYEAEEVQGHEVKKGKIVYLVKWKGYPESDNTWEPEDSLMEGASEIVTDYYDEMGGRAAILKLKKYDKRKATKQAGRAPKRAKRNGDAASGTPESSAWAPPVGSWETEIQVVENVEQAQTAKGGTEIVAYVRWRNGQASRHPVAVMKNKAPRRMCDFYEANLVFKQQKEPADSEALRVDDDPIIE